MPELPNDPEKLINYYMYLASAKTLTSIYDFLSELLTFQLDEMWPVDSNEYKAVADTVEAIKVLLAIKQNNIVAKSQALLD